MTIPVAEATQIHDQSSSGTTTGAITLSLGTISTDDIILVICALDGNEGNPTGSGNQSGSMNQVQLISESNVEIEMLWLRVGATPDTTVTISWSGTQQGRFMIVRISGALQTGNIVDVVGTGTTNSSTATAAVTAITSTVVNTLVIAGVAVDRNRVDAADGLTVANGFVELGVSGSIVGANGAGLLCGEKDLATITSSLSPTFGTWTADQMANYMINIKEEPAAGGFAHSQGYVIG